MDVNILKIILFSCESTATDLQTSEELVNVLKWEKFPLPEKVLNALSTSFSNLLCHKVSEQMYQRYSIQMKLVESLQLCSRIEDIFGILDTQFKNINVTSIAIKILIDNLTDQRIEESSIDTLIYLANLIIYFLPKYGQLKTYLQKIIISLAKHPSLHKSQEFLENILLRHDKYLSNEIIKLIYTYHTQFLIEKPIIDDFIKYTTICSDEKFEFIHSEKLILKDIVRFSLIFYKACIIIKNIFIKLSYDSIVLDFLQIFLNEVKLKCRDIKFFELYPLKLQACMMLMSIEPKLHTLKSKEQLLEFLKSVSLYNKDDLFILTMHSPQWLEFSIDVLTPPQGSSLFRDY